RALLKKRPGDLDLLLPLARSCVEQGARHSVHKEMEQAAQAFRRAAGAFQEMVDRLEADPEKRLLAGKRLLDLGAARAAAGDPDAAQQAVQTYRRAAKVFQDMVE